MLEPLRERDLVLRGDAVSNELIPQDVFGDISVQVGDDADFADMSTGGFLRRIDLKSKGRLIDKGVVKPGHFCVIKSSDEADDLGDSIDVLPIARRPKAIDMTDTSQILVSYDRGTDLFKDIERRSSQKDSHCQWGASFLVIERSTGQLFELFLGSKSNRREAPTIGNFLPVTQAEIDRYTAAGKEPRAAEPRNSLPLTLKSKNVENKKTGWSWFVIEPTPCSNPFTASQVPTPEVIRAELLKFVNPDDGNAPVATKKESTNKRAR
jgi:hypothetical protein